MELSAVASEQNTTAKLPCHEFGCTCISVSSIKVDHNNVLEIVQPKKVFGTAKARLRNCDLIKAGTNQTGLLQGYECPQFHKSSKLYSSYHERDNIVLFSMSVPKSFFTISWAKRKHLDMLQIITTSRTQSSFRKVWTIISCPLTLQRHLHSCGGKSVGRSSSSTALSKNSLELA